MLLSEKSRAMEEIKAGRTATPPAPPLGKGRIWNGGEAEE
jgi:hypothetical protein